MRLILAAVPLLLVLFIGGAWLGRYGMEQYRHAQFNEQLARLLPATYEVKITRGMPINAIADAVVQAGFPITVPEFIELTKWLKIDAELKAGYYRFAKNSTVQQALTAIADGDTLVLKVTFTPGITFPDLRLFLQDNPQLTDELKGMSDSDIKEQLGIEQESLEGLFLPDTYFYTPGDSDFSILRRSYDRLQETLAQLWEERQTGDVLQNPYQAIVLASIVEKETGIAAERPVIAAVFLNRLRIGMRLQADPTVIYGLGETFNGNITKKHLRTDTPYNTYTRGGLPPTPIALPSLPALAAVLKPDSNKYLYFVATGDGGHKFSATLKEHNVAVNCYQRRRC